MSKSASAARQSSSLWVDIGPVVLWFLVYNLSRRWYPDDAIYIGTGVFMVATLAALIYAWRTQNRIPALLVVSAVIVTAFGAIAIYLRDPIYIYIKPTIINLLYSYAILISYAFGINVWKILFKQVFTLPDKVWTIFAIRWAVFFQLLAVLNEFLWRHITDDPAVTEAARWFADIELTQAFWANFKLFGNIPLTFAFMALQFPLLLKYQKEEREAAAE
jgi:intracellular septation protein